MHRRGFLIGCTALGATEAAVLTGAIAEAADSQAGAAFTDAPRNWTRSLLVGPDGRPEANSDPELKNGIVGDGRRSSAKLGKRALDLKVEYAVKQIQGFIPPAK